MFLYRGSLSKFIIRSFYHFNSNIAVKELAEILDQYLNLVRDWTFEEVRQEQFPELPSRKKGLYVADEIGIKYWWDHLTSSFDGPHHTGQILKLSLTGKIHRASNDYLVLATNSLDWYRKQAKSYWSTEPNSIRKINDEWLFEGEAKVLDVIKREGL